jgi:hypothetical protein
MVAVAEVGREETMLTEVLKKLDVVIENQDIAKELLDELWEKVDGIGYLEVPTDYV